MSDTNKDTISSLGEMLYKSLRTHSDKIFQYVDETNERTTYSEVLQWSIRLATNLKKTGISRNDIISTCTHNQKYSFIPFVASQFLGVTCSNFDPNLSKLYTVHLLKLIQPRFLFVAVESLEFIETCLLQANMVTEIIVFGKTKKNYKQIIEYLEPNEDEDNFKPTLVKDDTNVAAIFFSSGTTGFPKGICLNHRSLVRSGRNLTWGDYAKGSDVVVLMYSPLYWISSLIFLLANILNGNLCVTRRNVDPIYTWKLIEKYKVTNIFLPPFIARDFLDQRPDNVDISSLKCFMTGSCAVPKILMEDLKSALPHTKVINCYGQTEIGSIITKFDPDEYYLQLKNPNSCGKMTKGIMWKIVDVFTEQVLGPYEEGELRFKNDDCIFNGYYKMDSSTSYDLDGFYKTGDIFYYDEDECFYIVDRIKEIFKYKGRQISPSVLEDILLLHPNIRDAAVIGVPHETDGELPMAVVVLNNKCNGDCADNIKAFFNARVISDYEKLRGGVTIVDFIPKTVTGKMKKNDLRRQILNNNASC